MKIELTSEMTSLYKIEKIVEQISNEYHLNDTYFACLSMAVQEAVKNAIVHGNQLEKEKIVTVEFDFSYSTVSCSVSDQGIGFNTEEELLKIQHNPSGKGLEIMQLTTDSLNFANNGSIVNMTFELVQTEQHKMNEKRRSMFLDAKLQKNRQGVKRNAE